MDIEFTIQDIFALTRPQWKLASNFEEASKVFSLAVIQNQKSAGLDKSAEPDEASSGPSTDDEMGDDLPMPNADSESEDDMVEVSLATPWGRDLTNSNHVVAYCRTPSRRRLRGIASQKTKPLS